jgi:hypothetical protein
MGTYNLTAISMVGDALHARKSLCETSASAQMLEIFI